MKDVRRASHVHHVFQVVDRIVVLRRGKVVADDIDPKVSTIEEVEQVITGDLDFVAGEMVTTGEDEAARSSASN